MRNLIKPFFSASNNLQNRYKCKEVEIIFIKTKNKSSKFSDFSYFFLLLTAIKSYDDARDIKVAFILKTRAYLTILIPNLESATISI